MSTKPNEPRLVWKEERFPGRQMRLYQKTHRGRPCYSIEVWEIVDSEWRCVSWLSLSRFDLRPLLRGVSEGIKDTGVRLNRTEEDRLTASENLDL